MLHTQRARAAAEVPLPRPVPCRLNVLCWNSGKGVPLSTRLASMDSLCIGFIGVWHIHLVHGIRRFPFSMYEELKWEPSAWGGWRKVTL